MRDRPTHPREPRVAAHCRVEFERLDRTVVAVSEDLSRHGVFVRTDELHPAGSEVALDLTLPDGEVFHVVVRVAHLLSPSAARAIGRHVGMGLAFIAAASDRGASFADSLDELIEERTPVPPVDAEPLRLVVAAASAPLRARIAHALAPAGFVVECQPDAAAALATCLARPPDGVLIATPLDGDDGLALVRSLLAQPRLARVPVVIVSEDPSDLTRLEAYRLGVRDCVTRPFLDEELLIRVRRATARPPAAPTTAGVVRGDLSEIAITTLLSLFELERTSGIVTLTAGPRAARLFLAGGRVVRIDGGLGDRPPRDRLMAVLDWDRGHFEFSAFEVAGVDEIGRSTTQLLLEHARLRDEAAHARALAVGAARV